MINSLILFLVAFTIGSIICVRDRKKMIPKPPVDCDQVLNKKEFKFYHEIHIPHESNCSMYYECTDQGLYEKSCDSSENYIPDKHQCGGNKCVLWKDWKNKKNYITKVDDDDEEEEYYEE